MMSVSASQTTAALERTATGFLIASCGLAFFCLTGPIAKPFAMLAAFAFGFNAALCYASAAIAKTGGAA